MENDGNASWKIGEQRITIDASSREAFPLYALRRPQGDGYSA